jgi:soluble lytic murein transglycosylase-like protein
MTAGWFTRRGLGTRTSGGQQGARLHRALLALSGVTFALTLSACQTPFANRALREPVAVLEPAPAPVAIAPVPTPAEVAPAPAPSIERPLATPRPTLTEKLGEVLVQHAPDLTPVDRARVAAAIDAAVQAHQLDPLLVLAIIEQESDFDPAARGNGGSMGLMQVRPFVARDIAKRHGIPWTGARTLLDPAANVSIGACYLGEMFEMYTDPALAISAYNMGPYRVQRMVARGRTPRPQYLLDVLERYQVFSTQFGPLVEPDNFEDADAN